MTGLAGGVEIERERRTGVKGDAKVLTRTNGRTWADAVLQVGPSQGHAQAILYSTEDGEDFGFYSE